MITLDLKDGSYYIVKWASPPHGKFISKPLVVLAEYDDELRKWYLLECGETTEHTDLENYFVIREVNVDEGGGC